MTAGSILRRSDSLIPLPLPTAGEMATKAEQRSDEIA